MGVPLGLCCTVVSPFAFRLVVFHIWLQNIFAVPSKILSDFLQPRSLQGQDGYDPRKSKVSDNTMEVFRNSPTNPDIKTVPGIGPASAKLLATAEDPADQITNTYQLFGKFLMLRGPGRGGDIQVSSAEHTERFWYWLKNRGISAHRSAIVKAIAEKSSTFFQGIYDANDYADSDEE